MYLRYFLVITLFVFPYFTMGQYIGKAGTENSHWHEAEEADGHNFKPGATVGLHKKGESVSAGVYLRLMDFDVTDDSSATDYFAEYQFDLQRAGTYVLWVAVSPQSESWASPMSLSISDSIDIPLKGKEYSSPTYHSAYEGVFGWIKLGPMHYQSGKQKLRFEVEERQMGGYVAYIDAFFMTQDLNLLPSGPLPVGSPQPSLTSILDHQSFESFKREVEFEIYEKKIVCTHDRIGPSVGRSVTQKLMERPIPTRAFQDTGVNVFGVHGMELPFVRHDYNSDKMDLIYELLARTGVQSFRTAESCWHRLGKGANDYSELDYQVRQASKYGITHLFTVGYPPAEYTVGNSNLSALKDGYEHQYKTYLRNLLLRYRDNKGLRYVELANEVDAPHVWWRNSTPAMYVREFKWLKEIVDEVAPSVKTVAFASTYARNDKLGGELGGRRFVEKCFELGINEFADAYSLHYTWPLNERGFVPYFRSRSNAKNEQIDKPLLNTEEASYGKPSDLIKLFARNFFLHGLERVDYYLARDWFEIGNLIHTGLFDMDWNPKERLLSYAVSVDAMKNRELEGIGEPIDGVEAYVLRQSGDLPVKFGKYAIVLWQNADNGEEYIVSDLERNISNLRSITVNGFNGIEAIVQWNLEELSVRNDWQVNGLPVSDEPIVVYCSELPNWRLFGAQEFLEKLDSKGTNRDGSGGMIPQVP